MSQKNTESIKRFFKKYFENQFYKPKDHEFKTLLRILNRKDNAYATAIQQNKELKEKLIALKEHFEFKVQSAEILKTKGTGSFSDSPDQETINRLDTRIFERNSFIKEISKLLTEVK